MTNCKIGFILDKKEIISYPDSKPGTSHLLINECVIRDYEIYLFPVENLFLNSTNPEALAYRPEINFEIQHINLNDLDMILIRQDPPVNMNYIFSCHILDYIDQSKTIIVNNPAGIRKCNEKLYINNFPDLIPNSIATANIGLIKEFLDKYKRIIVKPLDNYAGNGIFYLEKGDKNLNSILEKSTNNGKILIQAQEYVEGVKAGDKRLILLGAEPVAAIIRIPDKDDFRANMCKGSQVEPGEITDNDRKICKIISKNLLKDGLFFVGLDLIDDKIIEINVTSPGFFIRKINRMLNIRLEKKVVDYMESLISTRKILYKGK